MSTTTTTPAGTWNIDPSHSNVAFSVKHMGIATVRGTFNEFEGTLELGEDLSSSKAYGSVEVASVDTSLDRGEFGMTFNQALGSGNVIVSDQIKLSLDISAVKAA